MSLMARINEEESPAGGYRGRARDFGEEDRVGDDRWDPPVNDTEREGDGAGLLAGWIATRAR